MIFLNLPVADLDVATRFYTGLGFALNTAHSSAECSCLVVSDSIVVMLLTRDRFADFTAGPVADPHAGTAMISCLTVDGRAEVDDLVARALAYGGKPWLDPVTDAAMYGHSFADPDGHVWEVLAVDAGP